MKNILLLIILMFSLSAFAQANPLWTTYYTFKDFTPNVMACNSTSCFIAGFKDPSNSMGFRKLNLVTNQVTKLSTPPAYMNTVSESLTLVGKYIYTITEENRNKRQAKLFRYSILEDKWSELSDPLHLKLGPNSSKLILIGDQLLNVEGGKTYTYSIKNNKWTKLKESYHDRNDSDTFMHNGKIYLHGGFEYTQEKKDVEIYDIATNKWSYIIPSVDLNDSSVLSLKNNSVLIITLKNKKYRLYSWNFIKNTHKEISVDSKLLKSISPISLPNSVRVGENHFINNKKSILKIKYQ